MINTNKLRGLFAERGFSQSKMAEKIGVSPKTFYNKMEKRVFDSDEIETMIDVLGIPRKDCMDIFFADVVT